VARAIVRQATRQSHDIDSLRQAVAQHIDNVRDREAFVSGTQRLGSGARSVAAPAAGPAPMATQAGAATAFMPRSGAGPLPLARPAPAPMAPASAADDDRLSETAVAAAAPLVAEVLGPIAKLLVKKAAAQAQGRAQFVQILLAAAEPDDRARLTQLLQKLPR
jgi:hypothetical protein